jgi:cytoskeletal protein CcmA (bactofilin family)
MISKLGKLIATFAAILIVSILMLAPAQAADTRTGQNVNVGAGEVVNDDLYLAGSEITVDGKVNGDVIAVGTNVTINGDVNGNIIAAGSTVIINGKVSQAVRAAGNIVTLKSKIGRDLVAIAGTITTLPESEIGVDLLASATIINVNGPVSRNIICDAGTLVISNRVGGKVLTKATEVKIEAPAKIEGNLDYTSANEAVIATGATVQGKVTRVDVAKAEAVSEQTVATAISALISAIIAFILGFIIILTILKYAAALLFGLVIVLLAKKHVAEVVQTLRNKPWPCLGWGALIAVLVPIATAILCALIIGIPLAIAGLAIYIIALYTGHIITAVWLGKWMLRKLDRDDTAAQLIAALALGLLVIYILDLIPFVGIVTDLATILFGFGAIIYFIKGKLS